MLPVRGHGTDVPIERDDPVPDEGRADALPIEPRKARRMVRTPDAAPAEGGRECPLRPDRNRNPRRPSGVDAWNGCHTCRIVRPDARRPPRSRAEPRALPAPRRARRGVGLDPTERFDPIGRGDSPRLAIVPPRAGPDRPSSENSRPEVAARRSMSRAGDGLVGWTVRATVSSHGFVKMPSFIEDPRPRRIPFRLSGYTSGSSAVIRPRDGRSRAPDRLMPAPRDRGCRVVRMAGSGRLPSGRSEAEPATRARRGHFERNAPMPDHQTGCSPHSRMWPDL